MKILAENIFLPLILLFSFTAYGQDVNNIDSLKNVLHEQKEDTNKIKTLCDLSISYRFYYPDSGLAYGQQAMKLAKKLDYQKGIADSKLMIYKRRIRAKLICTLLNDALA